MTWPTEQAREAVAEPARLRIEGTWLVREVDEHTCGTGSGGYYGHHEPGCGLIPEVDLSTLPGWATLVRAERADAWEEGYDVGHRYARGVLPPDESDANPYAEAPDA